MKIYRKPWVFLPEKTSSFPDDFPFNQVSESPILWMNVFAPEVGNKGMRRSMEAYFLRGGCLFRLLWF